MKVNTLLNSEQESEILFDILQIGELAFTSHITGNTSLYVKDVLNVHEKVKSIYLEYNWADKRMYVYFGRIDLMRSNANYQTGVIASNHYDVSQFTMEQHKQLIKFFNSASYVKCGTASIGTKHAEEYRQLMLDNIKKVY